MTQTPEQWKNQFLERFHSLADQISLLDVSAFDPSLTGRAVVIASAALRCILDAMPELHGVTCVFQWKPETATTSDPPVCYSLAESEMPEVVSMLLRQQALLHALSVTTRDLVAMRSQFEQTLAETVRQLLEKQNALAAVIAAEDAAG